MPARFAIPAGAALRILTASGKIAITAEDRQDLEIDPPDRHMGLKDGGRTVEIRSRSGSLHVRCPRLTNVSVGAISGHVQLIGEFGSVKVSGVSGHIEVDSAAGDVDVRSVSGHLTVRNCRGRCQVNSKSGHISIGNVAGAARATSISGHVEIGTSGREEVELRTISGKMSVRVPDDRHPRIRLRSLSGRLHCDCVQGSDFEITASSVSGSIEVTAR